MSRTKWIVLACTVALITGVFVVLASGGPTPGVVDGDQFARLQTDGARVLDVRTEAEFAMGHIPGAENVPLTRLAEESEGWDPSALIVLYCATGSRSAEAARMLSARGFESVHDLTGGIAAWDGPVEGPEQVAVPPEQPALTAVPVMYEFYTDW